MLQDLIEVGVAPGRVPIAAVEERRIGRPGDAENVEGGLEDWAREGLPLVASDGGPGQVS